MERYKENNTHIMVIKLYTKLERFQRRQYHRYSYNFPMKYQLLEEEEAETLSEALPPEEQKQLLDEKKYQKGIVLDISGGGMHFVSEYDIEEDSSIMCCFSLPIQGQEKEYTVLSRVIQTKELMNRKNTYQHRIEFEKISEQEREELIQFIFEEERKHRRVKKG